MISLNYTLLVQLATFWILLAALYLLLYKPLLAVMRQRRDTIGGSRQRAQALEAQINEKMAAYQQALERAKATAGEERGRLREEAASAQAAILASARADATAKLEQMRAQIGHEAEKARQQLRQETRGHAARIASTILGRDVA